MRRDELALLSRWEKRKVREWKKRGVLTETGRLKTGTQYSMSRQLKGLTIEELSALTEFRRTMGLGDKRRAVKKASERAQYCWTRSGGLKRKP